MDLTDGNRIQSSCLQDSPARHLPLEFDRQQANSCGVFDREKGTQVLFEQMGGGVVHYYVRSFMLLGLGFESLASGLARLFFWCPAPSRMNPVVSRRRIEESEGRPKTRRRSAWLREKLTSALVVPARCRHAGVMHFRALPLLLLTSILGTACHPRPVPQVLKAPGRLLFVGNSFTYYNGGLEHHVKQLAGSASPPRRMAPYVLRAGQSASPLALSWGALESAL